MFQLTTEAIDHAELRRAVSTPHAGAVVSFEGTVRNHHQGRSVLRLEYEAHVPVAEKEGAWIVADAVDRFGLDAAVAVHRVGKLEMEDAAVMVVVSSPHRAEAFKACLLIIDESLPSPLGAVAATNNAVSRE